MRYQDKECLLELELPKNWQATTLRDGLDSLAPIGGTPVGGRASPARHAPSEAVLVHRLTPPTLEQSLPEYAEWQMKRLVRQGEPKHSVATLGELEAQIYEWSDGTRRLITWFVEPSREFWYRIDYGTTNPEVTSSALWKRAAGVLGDIKWAHMARPNSILTHETL
jgi:hypothetical protein